MKQRSEVRSQKSVGIKAMLFEFILNPKRVVFIAVSAVVFTAYGLVSLDFSADAAPGINETINFQGKVVNSNGTNVADGQYTFVFRIYNVSSGGSHLWTETQNNVQVTAGVFRVSLGSVTPITGVDFNSDSLYLGINFNSDGEMTPRIRFASVPYAFNAKTVSGLTVTNTTGTLTIPNSKTVQFGGAFTTSAHDLSFTMSGGTSLTLPTTGTLATLGGVETLSNKSFSSTVTFDGITTDITTDTNETLTISPNGTGNVLITTGAGGQAALVVDKTGVGDIFAASSSGVPKFVIKSDGNASSSAGFTVDGIGSLQSTNNQTLTVGGGSTGDLVIGRTSQRVWLPGFDCSGFGNSGKLTTTAGGILTCAADGGSGDGSSNWTLETSLGILRPNNNTLDFLWGGTSTSSAKFRISGDGPLSGTISAASVSANTAFAGLVVDNRGIGDLFTASSSGLSRFVITNSGNVGIGLNLPQARLDIKDANSVATLGSEKIISANDREFTIDTGNWTGGTTWYIDVANSNSAEKSAIGTTPLVFNNTGLDSAPVAGNTYLVEYYYSAYATSSGTLTPSFGGKTMPTVGTNEESDIRVEIVTVVNSDPLTFTPSNNFYGKIDDVSIIQISNSSVALRLESSDGSTNPLEIRTGGNNLGNTFIGNGSGKYSISGGDGNTAIGYQTLANNSYGSQNSAIGYQSLYKNTTGSLNVANGYRALYSNNSGGWNVALGVEPLYRNLTGERNLGIGRRALYNNISGDFNIAIGDEALNQNTGGSNNTAIGNYALYNNLSGIYNDVFGYSALYSNQTGSFNTASGYQSLYTNWSGSYNLALGYSSLYSNFNGSFNTGIGYSALHSYSSSGINNIGIGFNAGFTNNGQYDLVNGSNNIFLGANSGPWTNNANFNNSIAIGTYALVNASNSLVLGGASTSQFAVNVGIGTATPSATLNIVGGNRGGNALLILNQTGISTNDILAASSSGVTKFRITNDGTASSSAGFTVDGIGNVQSTNNQTLTIGGGTTGNLIIGRASQAIYLPGFENCTLKTTTGGLLNCGADLQGSGSSNWVLNTTNGTISPINNTVDFLLGSTATTSAKFAVLGIAGTDTPVASVSATSGSNQNKGIYISGDGSLQSVRMNNLTIGGNTTGNIYLRPGNSLGLVKIIHEDFGTGGLVLTTNETASTIKEGRLKFGSYSNAGYFTGILASAESNANQLIIGGGSGSEYAATSIRFRTAENVDTLTGIERMRIDNKGWVGIGEIGDGNVPLQSQLYVTGGSTGGNAALIVNQTGVSTNDILVASSSGTTKFVIKNDGTASTSAGLTINGAGLIQSTNLNSLTIGSSTTGNVFIRPGNTPGLTFLTNGRIGLGTSNPLATLDIRPSIVNGGTVAIASVSGATSFAGLIVDNSGSGDLFTASSSGDTRFTIRQNGVVQIGTTTNGLTFDYTNGGPTYTGTGRPTKTITLSPEYNGAILTASGSANINGSMTADASPSASTSNFRTYYEWTSTATSLQDYTVAVRVTLPRDFSDWDTTANNAIRINYNTGSNVVATNRLDVFIYNTDSGLASPGIPVSYRQANVSAKTWTTVGVDRADLIDGNEALDTAGETMIIYLKMSSSGTHNYTQIGDIQLNYLSKF